MKVCRPKEVVLGCHGFNIDVPVQVPIVPPKLYTGLTSRTDRMVLPAPEGKEIIKIVTDLKGTTNVKCLFDVNFILDCIPEPGCSSGPIIEPIHTCRPCCPYFYRYDPSFPSFLKSRRKRSLLAKAAFLKLKLLEARLKSKTRFLFLKPPKSLHHEVLLARNGFKRKFDGKQNVFSNLYLNRGRSAINPLWNRGTTRDMMGNRFKNSRKVLGKKKFAPKFRFDGSKASKNLEAIYPRLPPDIEFYNKMKIEEIFPKIRKPRAAAGFDAKETPFFSLREIDREEKPNLNSILLESLNFEHLLPQTPLFYWLNAPIRMLKHFNNLQKQIKPVVSSVPKVLQTSQKYLINMGKQFGGFMSNFVDGLTNLKPPILRTRSYVGNDDSVVFEEQVSTILNFDDEIQSKTHEFEDKKRVKRTLLKVMDEDEIRGLLEEKLSHYNQESQEEMEEEPILQAVTDGLKSDEGSEKKQRKYVIEKVDPKSLLEEFKERGKQVVPGFDSFLAKLTPNPGHVDDQNVKETIVQLIHKAKHLPGKASSKTDFDDSYLTIIKSEISSILSEIQNLVHADFEKEFCLFEDLLKLQVLMDTIVKDWKVVLINEKVNDMREKIRILDAIHDAQTLKERIACDITEKFNIPEYHHKKKLIKLLVRLQKLQSILLKIVEEFSGKITTGTQFDIENEIRYVESLQQLSFVQSTRRDHLEKRLKEDRDDELQKQMNLLEDLRDILDKTERNKHDQKLIQISKVIWEINNIQKLQQDSFKELNGKMKRNLKTRRELKIIFDLQKQLESCETKRNKLIDDILARNLVLPEKIDKKEDDLVGLKKFQLNRLNLFLKPNRSSPLLRGKKLRDILYPENLKKKISD